MLCLLAVKHMVSVVKIHKMASNCKLLVGYMYNVHLAAKFTF